MRVWVAEADRRVVAFVAATLHRERLLGEIWMLAVDPDHQERGAGTALTEFATDWLRDSGMRVAMVETGGDSGHAPARRVYEKADYTPSPAVRYSRPSDPHDAGPAPSRRLPGCASSTTSGE